MSIDFKELQEYPVDINNFSYDAEAMVNNIYIGPQGELLEQLDYFNTTYGTDIEITKNFTLKPGGYNKLKEAYSKWVLRWDMKPNGISSIFNRIREYGWRFNSFRDASINLENIMMNLRSSGLQWQNNTDDFGIELERTRDIIINSLDRCKELYPHIDIEVKMLPMPVIRDRHGSHYGGRRGLPELCDPQNIPSTIDYCVTFILHINSPTMTVHTLHSDETVDQIEIECGDIIVVSGTSLLQMISRNWGRTALQHGPAAARSSHYYLEAVYLDNMTLSKHPYISGTSDKYAYELDGAKTYSHNICTGNMSNEFRNTIANSQIEAHITYLVTWLENYYIPQTNPLNRIKLLKRYGRDVQFEALANEGNDAFNATFEKEGCNFGTHLSGLIYKYARKGDSRPYSGTIIQRDTIEYNERVLAYIQRIDVKDFPCNTCLYDMDCDHQTNIMLLFRLEALEPMEEAYIGMFLEMHELDRYLHNKSSITFIEQLVHDTFRWRIDEEYDKLILCNEIVQIIHQHETDSTTTINWLHTRYLDLMVTIWQKTNHTINDLYKIVKMNGGANWDQERLLEFNIPTPIQSEDENVEDILPDPEIDPEILRELEQAVLTPEEMTLRWASINGGANNL